MDSSLRKTNIRLALAAGAVFVSGAVRSAESQKLRVQLSFDQESDQVRPTQTLVTQIVSVEAWMNLNGNIQSVENSRFLGGRHNGRHQYVATDQKAIRLGGLRGKNGRSPAKIN
jgi:hypothetical protein